MPSQPSSGSQGPEEFRGYRRALTVAYVTVLALGSALIVVSIVSELFFRRGERHPASPPADPLQCNQDVQGLLEDLGNTAVNLQREAVTGNATDLGGRWEEFAKEWQKRWDLVNTRCQFDELADTGLGPAYDRMASVHRSLPTLKLKYRELMKRFSDEQAAELADMRSALEKSRALLLSRSGMPPGTKP
ncbi:MAG: hypothetical protein HY698_01760 [Deltaproteobacteria bacterium]|nr:hypothetical protein [Deltaproteobacteria bacterium]